MTLVDDAFATLKSNLEITTGEQTVAQNRHALIRDHIRARWDLIDDFLTGSYDRHTKTKPLKDVDMFAVVDAKGDEGHLANGPGTDAVSALAEVLNTRWPDITTHDTVVTISYAGEDVASYEVAPAFLTGRGYKIPNGTGWMETNPNQHADLVTAKNKDCDNKFVPLIKMIKGMNREAGEPISPSFLIEVLALDLVDPPLGRYQDEVRFFLASAADAIHQDWPDPPGIGPDVNGSTPTWERANQETALREWLAVAEEAILLENEQQERAAAAKWKTLFGRRMPNV